MWECDRRFRLARAYNEDLVAREAPAFYWDLPSVSKWVPAIAENVVATSQPLAAGAGV